MKSNGHRYSELDGLFVTVDNVIFMPNLDAPVDKPHPFVYFLSIQNESSETIVITGRKWIVDEDGTELIVVEGEGVVGQKPRLGPGEHFSYNSYHVTGGAATARGMFFGNTIEGKKIRVPIPRFKLSPPC